MYAGGCNKPPSQPVIVDLLHLYVSKKVSLALLITAETDGYILKAIPLASAQIPEDAL